MKCRELVSVAELETSERTAFVNAVLALKVAPSLIASAATAVTNGGGTLNRYDDYVWMHSTVGSSAHFGSAFGPWHREFLRQLEFDLRQVSGNPDIVIPYWDWTTGRAPGDPNWPFTDDLLGPLGDATGAVTSGPFSNPATWRMNIRRTVFRDDGLAQVPDPYFSRYRGMTLHHYTAELRLAFDRSIWSEKSKTETRQKSGNWVAPKPLLFPGGGGRHKQRAFRDALADILPPDNGFLPTLRIPDSEVESWFGTEGAYKRMQDLLSRKISN